MRVTVQYIEALVHRDLGYGCRGIDPSVNRAHTNAVPTGHLPESPPPPAPSGYADGSIVPPTDDLGAPRPTGSGVMCRRRSRGVRGVPRRVRPRQE